MLKERIGKNGLMKMMFQHDIMIFSFMPQIYFFESQHIIYYEIIVNVVF